MVQPAENKKTVRLQLLHAMKQGIFAKCERLPRETVLAETLGISRTQLRDALSDLEREGFITRRQGVGTMINRHVLQVKSRMDIETEFLEMIRKNGYEPSASVVEVSENVADKILAEKLHISEGTPVICICLVCRADGKPAIYCEDILAKRLIKGNYELENFQFTIFQLLEKFGEAEAYMDLAELHPVIADEKLAQILEIPLNTPLLNMQEIDYDIEGMPIFYSNQYFVDKFFQQTVLRKKF